MLTPALASTFSRIVLAGIRREYPNKLDHVLNGDSDSQSPRQLHPAFFGCFDWHSAVHGHWLLARLLRLFPDFSESREIAAALNESLTPTNIAVEAAYLSRPNSGSFERTYGWAWLLKLAEELSLSASPIAAQWSAALGPLAEAFVKRYLEYLPKLDYPIRAGVHANTGFGLAFAHDYALRSGHTELQTLVERKAIRCFGQDKSYPAHLEPGGADFFSPALIETDLMRRVLPRESFAIWFDGFLPDLGSEQPANLLSPARVSDRADLQIVHLDGLNLSRAWCMKAIAAALPPDAPARAALERSATNHIAASLPHVASGHYGGEHWLATFAVLALTGES